MRRRTRCTIKAATLATMWAQHILLKVTAALCLCTQQLHVLQFARCLHRFNVTCVAPRDSMTATKCMLCVTRHAESNTKCLANAAAPKKRNKERDTLIWNSFKHDTQSCATRNATSLFAPPCLVHRHHHYHRNIQFLYLRVFASTTYKTLLLQCFPTLAR